MTERGDKIREERNRKKRALLFWGMMIFFLVSTSFSVKLYLGLRKSLFWSLGRSTFALATGRQELLVFSLHDSEGLVLKLPKEKKIQLTHGFGQYEWGKVYQLSQQEKRGGLLLKEAVWENLSVPIFGYFYDKSGDDYSKIKPKSFFNLVFRRALKGEVKTDLNKFDLAILYLKSKRLNERKITVEDFEENLEVDFKDKKLRKEQSSIEIFNSTEYSGLAQKTARLLENAGGRVVRVADIEKREENCLLLLQNKAKQSYTYFWLVSVFGCRTGSEDFTEGRADITLIIGEEYWKKLNEKW